jgi:hypothetical protein
MCYIVSRHTFSNTGKMNSFLLGSVNADTAEDAWRQAHYLWPNQEIDVDPVPAVEGERKEMKLVAN